MKAERVAKELEHLNKALEYADAYGIDLGGYYQFGTKNLIEMINAIQQEAKCATSADEDHVQIGCTAPKSKSATRK